MAPRASSAPERARPAATLGQITLIAMWLGAATFFAATIAPAAFAVLPTRELAGALVGRVLPALFVTGALVGLVALGLEAVSGIRVRRIGRVAAVCIISVACAVAQFAIAPRITAARGALSAPLASLSVDDPQRIAFGRLHMLSVGWLAVAMLGGAAAIVLAVLTLRGRPSP